MAPDAPADPGPPADFPADPAADAAAPEPEVSGNYLVVEELQRMPRLLARGLLYLVVLFVAAAVIYAVAGRIDIVVQCPAMARPVSDKLAVVSAGDGVIAEVYVAAGQAVRKGAPLFRVDTQDGVTHQVKLRELNAVLPQKEAAFEAQIAALRTALADLAAEHESALRVHDIKREQNVLQLQSNRADQEYWRAEEQQLVAELANTQTLFDRQLTSLAEYNNIRSRRERARVELAKLGSQHSILTNEAAILAQDLASARITFAGRRQQMQADLRKLELDRDSALTSLRSEQETVAGLIALRGAPPDAAPAGSASHLVAAEKDGVISALFYHGPGAYVRQAEPLATLVPDGTGLFMELQVANRDIGFIDTGMPVKYKFDAFPYFDYGSLTGRVVTIAAAATDDAALGHVYIVNGSLDKDHFLIHGRPRAVKPGMTARAEIVTERKSLAAILFGKLKQKF